MKQIKIRHQWTKNLLFEGQFGSLRDAIQAAVKSRASLSGADLSGADLSGADLSGADLSGADLRRASLSGADLSGASLRRASLSGADLRRASLRRASLSGADLSGAVGINKYLTTDLYLLADQPGKIRAYKLVTSDGIGPWNGGLKYEIGKPVSEPDADTNENLECAQGINLATLNWCMREWREDYRILIAEFEAKDIAAIPIGSDGKFRVRECLIVGEKDLVEIGLVPATAETGTSLAAARSQDSNHD